MAEARALARAYELLANGPPATIETGTEAAQANNIQASSGNGTKCKLNRAERPAVCINVDSLTAQLHHTE